MLCPKCGIELTSEQKVCVACGALTPAAGYYYDDKKRFVLTHPMKLALIAVGALVLLSMLYLIFRSTPPQVVAKRWLDNLAARNINRAAGMVTEDYKLALADRFSDLREVSDNLYMDVSSSGASVMVYEPKYAAGGDKALITAALVDSGGQAIKQMNLELIRDGRSWKINGFN